MICVRESEKPSGRREYEGVTFNKVNEERRKNERK